MTAAPAICCIRAMDTTGIRYSALGMIQAIPRGSAHPGADARASGTDPQLPQRPGWRALVRTGPWAAYHCWRAAAAVPAGVRRPLSSGARSVSMYTHAHLRYAQALAQRVGDAQGFFQALCQANPIGIASIVPRATLRQANCYYSSSDAAFADRYRRPASNMRAWRRARSILEGGWRVYSSGAGIAFKPRSCGASSGCTGKAQSVEPGSRSYPRR